MAQARATDLSFRSEDGGFALALPDRARRTMLHACRRADTIEVGGILIGYYGTTLDRAFVTTASSAPRDSRGGPTWFERGTIGLQRRLDRVWRTKKHFYLGEWHYHPHASAEPSLADLAQMAAFAKDPAIRCPEPLLLIVGGNPHAHWNMQAFVFPLEREALELLPLPECEHL